MYPPHHLGGYELSCRDVMDRFAARGHQITVLTTTMRLAGVEDPPDERARGVRRDLAFYWDDHRITNPPVWRRLAMERHNQEALRAAIAGSRPEVVSVWNMGAMSLGLLTACAEAGLPLVIDVSDEWPVYGPHVDAWTRLFARRPRFGAVVRRVTGVPTSPAPLSERAAWLYISRMIKEKIEARSIYAPRITAIVHSGFDSRDFPIAAVPDARPWRWRLLYAGRIDERKGIHVAVDALTRLPAETTLDIDGRGDAGYRARLQEQVRRLGLDGRVRFLDTPRPALKDRYRDADVVVFPTLWEEPFGLVPVEAMACATPVVATGTGGSGEFLADGVNCLRIPVGDATALAAAVERLAGDPALREHLTTAGLRTAAELTVDRLADVLEEWHLAAARGFVGALPPEREIAIGR